MAPPYRKSCLTCVKAKRRCEFSSGSCKRCINKNLSCSLNRVRHDETPLPSFSEDIQKVNYDFIPADDVGDTLAETGLVDFALDVTPEISRQDYATDDDVGATQWLATLTRGQNSDLDIQWPGFDQDIIQEGPSADQITGLDNIFETTTESSKNDIPSASSCIYYERVTYVSRQFRTYPGMFVKRGQNPFIHRVLYEQNTPLAISDAMSCCALYSGKNEYNELLVFNDLSSKARNLTARNCFSMTTSDLLASTQALLLYQIIRLFDGDIRLRAEAENAEPVMMAWAERLLGFSTQLPPIPETGFSSDRGISTHWKDWVYAESVRRTVLTCYMLQGIYSFLKFGYDNVATQIYKLSFTAQARIWNAPSQYVWDGAIKEYKHFEVTIKQWDAAMIGAENDDLEELGVIVLASMKGINVCYWVGKENLGRWDLANKCITGH